VEGYQKECSIKAGRLSIYIVVFVNITDSQRTGVQAYQEKTVIGTQAKKQLEYNLI